MQTERLKKKRFQKDISDLPREILLGIYFLTRGIKVNPLLIVPNENDYTLGLHERFQFIQIPNAMMIRYKTCC